MGVYMEKEYKKNNSSGSFFAILFIVFIIGGIVFFINYNNRVKVYYCDDVDILFDETKCRRFIYKKGTKQYYCYVSEYNEHLEGDKCKWTSIISAIPHYSCPYGYTGGPAICTKTRYDYYNKRWVTEYASSYVSYYTCVSGTLIGSNCYSDYSYNAPYNLLCDPGFDAVGEVCIKSEVYDAHYKYEKK